MGGCSHSLRHREWGAYHNALYQEWQRKILRLHARGCKLGDTLDSKGRVFFTINIEPNPLSGLGSVRVSVTNVGESYTNVGKSYFSLLEKPAHGSLP